MTRPKSKFLTSTDSSHDFWKEISCSKCFYTLSDIERANDGRGILFAWY
jgi:hypothetical protein